MAQQTLDLLVPKPGLSEEESGSKPKAEYGVQQAIRNFGVRRMQAKRREASRQFVKADLPGWWKKRLLMPGQPGAPFLAYLDSIGEEVPDWLRECGKL